MRRQPAVRDVRQSIISREPPSGGFARGPFRRHHEVPSTASGVVHSASRGKTVGEMGRLRGLLATAAADCVCLAMCSHDDDGDTAIADESRPSSKARGMGHVSLHCAQTSRWSKLGRRPARIGSGPSYRRRASSAGCRVPSSVTFAVPPTCSG